MVVRSLTCAALLTLPSLVFADDAAQQNQRRIDQQQQMLQAQAAQRAANAAQAAVAQEQQRQQQRLAEQRAYLYQQQLEQQRENARAEQDRERQTMVRRNTVVMSKDWRTLRRAVARYRPGIRRIGVLVRWLHSGLPVESDEAESRRSFSRITHGAASSHYQWDAVKTGGQPYNFANPTGGVMNPATNPTAPIHHFNFAK